MYLKLSQIKKHLNINEDFNDDDEYLLELSKVTENVVQKHIDRELKDLEDEEGNMLDVWILSFEAASQDEGDEA